MKPKPIPCKTDWYEKTTGTKPAGYQSWIFYTTPDNLFLKTTPVTYPKALKLARQAAISLNQASLIVYPIPFLWNKQKSRAFTITPGKQPKPMYVKKYTSPTKSDIPEYLHNDIAHLKHKRKLT